MMKHLRLLVVTLLAFALSKSWAQDRNVTGTVTSSEDGLALPGVNVLLKGGGGGGGVGTITDVNGTYSIPVSDGATLIFSFIGYATQEVEVGARAVIDVQLSTDATELSEVVVTGMGISREKASLGYSVQEVSGEELDNAKETNIVNALQGQIAGVQIQGTTGTLGGSSRIVVRGANSLKGSNQPLFVVDGVPIDNRNFATNDQMRGFGGGSYDYGNSSSDINPADIESMTVLKGAASTAIYGSRGSNGVILITTKNGSKRKGIGVDVNSAVTFDNAMALIDYQREYGGGAVNTKTKSGFNEFTQDGVAYLSPNYGKDGAWGPKYDPNVKVRHWDSWDPNASNYKETRPWVAPSKDNDYKAFFETGVTLTNSVALSSSNDKGSFRLGYTNVNQDGIMPNSNLQRNTVTFSATQNLTDRLTASFSGSFVRLDTKGRSVTGYNGGNPMQAFTQWYQTQLDTERLKKYFMSDGKTHYTWNPKGLVLDKQGNLVRFNHKPNYFSNPYWTRYNNLQNDNRNRLFGNVRLSYKITDNITLSGKIMRDGYSSQAYEGLPQEGRAQSGYKETFRAFNEMNYEAILSFSKDFDPISLEALIGMNRMDQKYNRTISETVGGTVIKGFFNLANSKQPVKINTLERNKRINSVFATSSIGYKNMLYLDLSIRNDWSSTLSKKDRSYLYPAATASFIFSEIANQSWLSFGKVRIGYGQAGTDTDPYQLDDVYLPRQSFNGNPKYSMPSSKNNRDLVNELTTEKEIGIEAKFLENRVGVDVSYYDKTTDNQIMDVTTSATTGYTRRWVNAGSIRNKGLEIMLTGTPLKIGDFKWDVALNFSTFDSEIVSLHESVKQLNIANTWGADLRLVPGKPYMAIYGKKFQRKDGKILVDSKGFPKISKDRHFLGSSVPDFTGGFKNSFSWKGIELSFLIDFQKGGSIHSTSIQWANYSGMTPETVFQDGVDIRKEGYLVKGVLEDGTPNTKRISAQSYFVRIYNVGEPYVFDASFIKLREATISYKVPSNLIDGLPIRDLRVAVFGRNLAILHSNLPYLDPQVVVGTGNQQGLENAQIPSTRSIGFNISFKL